MTNEVDVTTAQQSVFVTAHLDITGHRGKLLGGAGAPGTAAGELHTPDDSLVLWRVVERVEIEQELEERVLAPDPDGKSLRYSYRVRGGGGGLFPIDEAGHFKADLVAVFAPPSFLPTIGEVEILSTTSACHSEPGSERTPATLRKTKTPSVAQLEGRLFRASEEAETVYFVEQGVKRALQSPTCGRLRFGDGWQRLIQTLPSPENVHLVPEGPPLTVAECAEGRLIACFPAPDAYWVRQGQRHRIESEDAITERYGTHWRIKLIYLRRAEMDAIPLGSPLTSPEDAV